MSDDEREERQPKAVRRDSYPLAVYVRGGMLVGWGLWVERTTYDDGTVATTYRQQESPGNG